MEKREIDFDPEKLQALADKLSQHFWQDKLQIPVVWNGRLTRAMGRFVFRQQGKKREPLKIEMSKYAAQFVDREIFIAVLLHEMCHYHLFIQNKPYQDHHPVFEQELRRVGAISTNTVKLPTKVYKLTCQHCKKSLGMMKRFNPDRYRSGCCQAPIQREEDWMGSFQYDGRILKNSKVRIILS
ncbi:SprT-like domain-containing protein [Ammoniphilus sp. CFH 90114]|uniref:SprT-like domain-containing protein n=1 Tax=Ammoniphilus sp. CFH 90114 TaxID=2493665 RepID=UPI0013E943AF|nr:SprT-like domain-containing protein [Ammoniphilus sp. CFH 90114]